MHALAPITPRWHGAHQLCVVAASGPSLTPAVAELTRDTEVIAVNDAYRLVPWAFALYACDTRWWKVHNGAPDFKGHRYTTQGRGNRDDKAALAIKWNIQCVVGRDLDGFSYDPGCIHYGSNGGFQAINLAILFGATRIVLVGFDMRFVDGKRHFFGDHPSPLHNVRSYELFIPKFEKAAKTLPPHIEIINATKDSALTCFPYVPLDQALGVAYA